MAKRFKIPPSTLTSILHRKDFIAATPSNSVKKRQKAGGFPELEKALVTWFSQCRQQNVPVSGILMKEKAKIYAEKLGIRDFRASDGWFDRFKKRNNITFRKICGESASVDNNVCIEWKQKLSEIIREYEFKNVFNADETGLFYKCLPDRTMCFKNEKCRGGKHSKERITILLCANMDGSEKLKPLIIGKSAKPRCFKNVRSFPIPYRANQKAWMTNDLFVEWLKLLNSDMERQKRKILLFVDNCTAHNSIPVLSHVKVEFLPVNTTSMLQPLDQGIIKNFKTFYRKEVVSQLLSCIEDQSELKITVLTAMNIADKAWRNITQSTIRNCFRACGFITPNNQYEDDVNDFSVHVNPIQWNRLLQNEENDVTFDDFVHCDDDVVVAEILTDNDIVCTATDEADEVEDDDEEELPTITFKEARTYIDKLRILLTKASDINDDVFSALVTIDNAIDQARHRSLLQKNITDYFSP